MQGNELETNDSWLSSDNRAAPLWLRTLHASLPICAVCILYGEIHDLHPLSMNGSLRPDTTINSIWKALEDSGFEAMLTFDPLRGLSIEKTSGSCSAEDVRKYLESKIDRGVLASLMQTPSERAAATRSRQSGPTVSFDGMDALAEAVAESNNPAVALVIDHTSQVVNPSQGTDPSLERLMLASLEIANSHAVYNGKPLRFPRKSGGGLMRRPIIWLADKLSDLPTWLTSGDGIRQIAIPKPGIDARTQIARLLVAGQVDDDDADPVARRFADATEGFSTRGMFEAVQLAKGTGSVASNIEGAVRTYREGLSENPWQSPRLREQLAVGDEILTRRVLGQDEAVKRVLDILKRSALGLTGAHQRKASTAPKGVLYFAGPTGVGKTEMAKAIAELVFADDQALIRFDMSEFQDNHAKIRLVGAPPSYVGYGSGGELTNAVRQRPHSIVLFDEMDKAGSEVYDLFLQILSDGRLTDGSGQTVQFGETIIIFTSNQGVAAAGDILHVDMEDPDQASLYDSTIRAAVEGHFREALGRPELLGRIGDNIVVFKPMYGETARNLANKFIDTILSNVRIRVGNDVGISDKAREALIEIATRPEHLDMGGRGITLALESYLTNPLGRALFEIEPNAKATVESIAIGAGGEPEVRLAL